MSFASRRLLLLLVVWIVPTQAWAWWEATLQQVEIDLVLNQDGTARVRYDLRYHIDRGQFEGVDLVSPSHEIEWDRLASFIEDARGQRFPVRISRRGRDSAFVVRVANPPGLRSGWATVHLEYTADLLACCLRLDGDGRERLSWSALTWDVGMDRILARVHLEPFTEGLEVDEETAAEFAIDGTLEEVLAIERIRPVRWYEMRLGLLLPEGWLQRHPERFEEQESRPSIDDEETEVAIPVHQERDPRLGALTQGIHVGLAVLCILMLAFKSWVTARGYGGRRGPVPALLLPRVPAALRWSVIVLTVLTGAWLQSHAFLAAGTLAVAAGVLLSLRAQARLAEERPRRWDDLRSLEALGELAARRESGRQRWAVLFDGTSVGGLPLLLGLGALPIVALWQSRAALVGVAVEGLVIDLTLTFAAFFLTARRRDALPAVTESARSLQKAALRLRRLAAEQGVTPRVRLGLQEGPDDEEVRLELCSEHGAEPRVVITAVPELRLAGWSLALVAAVNDDEGRAREIRARRGGAMARRLRRALASQAKAP